MASPTQSPTTPLPTPSADAATPNLAGMGRCLFFWRAVAAVVSGLLLSAAFPPLRWDLLAWIAFLPFFVIPQPRLWRERLAVGYIFGYVHFASSLLWLNEVGFGAGFLLAIWCALFPMAWYALFSALAWRLRQDLARPFPGAGFLFIHRTGSLIIAAIFAAALWTSLEWVRAWLLTGFPWNQLGISQYRRAGLIQCAAFTGVYGISFVIMLVNAVLAIEATRIIRFAIIPGRRSFPWHFALVTLVLIPVCWWGRSPESLPPESTPNLTVLAVQGNLPQCRFWTEEQFQDALTTYVGLTRTAFAELEESHKPDLVIWPECAVPADLNNHTYTVARNQLLQEIDTPLLLGATQFRLPHQGAAPQDALLFNSAFLLNPQGQTVEYYDKVHRVPFGEYTPFGDQLPWLRELIGMGRDLTPGRDLHLFNLPNGAYAGVNICFEDVFAELSRNFARRGANLLMTITNDSWYNESSGAEQHLSHVVFRAIENRRPFFRSGNNSHTCLITPNGRVLGQLTDTKTGKVFARASALYELPIFDGWGETFYTRHGNLFAHACAALSVLVLAWLAADFINRKKSLLAIIRPKSKATS